MRKRAKQDALGNSSQSSNRVIVLVRSEWLYRVVREAEVFAGLWLERPFEPADLKAFIDSVPPPTTPLEALVLRGVRSDLAEQARSYQRRLATHTNESPAREVEYLLNAQFQKPWTVPELARRVHCNRTDLERAFKRRTGSSIHRFLAQKRIEAAKNLLADSDDGIKTVAQKVGYSGIANFYRHFERITGATPRHYRDRSRSSSR